MPITKDELDNFHRFASGRIDNGGKELSLSDLVVEWDSTQNREDVNAAIREGIVDIDAGRTRPAAEVTEELRQKNNIPQ